MEAQLLNEESWRLAANRKARWNYLLLLQPRTIGSLWFEGKLLQRQETNSSSISKNWTDGLKVSSLKMGCFEERLLEMEFKGPFTEMLWGKKAMRLKGHFCMEKPLCNKLKGICPACVNCFLLMCSFLVHYKVFGHHCLFELNEAHYRVHNRLYVL